MAASAINLPPGFQLEDNQAQSSNVNLPPGFKLEGDQQGMSFGGFAKNAGSDIADIAKSVPDTLSQMAMIPKKMFVDMPLDVARTAGQMVQGRPFMQTPVGQQASQFGDMVKHLPDNIMHPYDHPVKAGLDAATALGGATEAMRPLMPSVGRTLSSAGEQLSGLEHKTPGVLADAYKDSSLQFGPGMDKARQIYKANQNEDLIRPELANAAAKTDLVTESKKILSGGGELSPDEALEARKALDKTKKHWSDLFFRQTREQFDTIAKQKFGDADAAFKRSIKSEALRSVFPLNKTGGASAFKTALLTPMLPIMSPATQGLAATAAGVAGRKLFSPLGKAAPVLGSVDSAIPRDGMKQPINESPNLQENLNQNNDGNPEQGQLDPTANQTNHAPIITEPKTLTKEIARKFLDLANGSKELARELARKAGYTW